MEEKDSGLVDLKRKESTELLSIQHVCEQEQTLTDSYKKKVVCLLDNRFRQSR